MTNNIDLKKLFEEKLENGSKDLLMPPPSFDIMCCEILEFNELEKSIVVSMKMDTKWLNPYKTMQGGMIAGALDNAIGPLSLLVAPINMTKKMELEYLKPITMDHKILFLKASVISQNRRVIKIEACVEDKDGVIYTKALATQIVLNPNYAVENLKKASIIAHKAHS